MKRSKKLSLVLMGIMLTTNLVACGDRYPEAPVFKNQQECVQGGFTAEQCAKFEAEAKENSPKFTKREECEAQFGKEMCNGETDSSGSSFWVPALAGFAVGNILTRYSISPTISRGMYNNPNNPGQLKPADIRSMTASQFGRPVTANQLSKSAASTTNQLGKSVVPRSATTFRGGFGSLSRGGIFGG